MKKTKYTIVSFIYLDLKNKYFFNDTNLTKIKLPNSVKIKDKEGLGFLINYNENTHKATLLNVSGENIVIGTKVIENNCDTVLENRDLIYIDGLVHFFFYSKESRLSSIKLRFKIKERFLKKEGEFKDKDDRKLRNYSDLNLVEDYIDAIDNNEIEDFLSKDDNNFSINKSNTKEAKDNNYTYKKSTASTTDKKSNGTNYKSIVKIEMNNIEKEKDNISEKNELQSKLF